jgi:hypothetical protein
MHRRTEGARRLGQQLALEDAFSCADNWLGRFAGMLVEGQKQLRRQWRRLYR